MVTKIETKGMRMMGGERKEQLIQVIYAVGGCLLFALGVNLIIVPLNLYNGGFMGIAQLIRTFLIDFLHIPAPKGLDISSVIYFILNVPLFYMGLKIMGKGFAVKTLLTVAVQSVFLAVVPIPAAAIIEDRLTACVIGGIAAGTGAGLVLRGRSSGGGQDIIGLCCAKRFPNVSVGQINILINAMVYIVCLFMFDIETVVYSLIYATVIAMALDRVHIQNINTSVMIFTKQEGVDKAIMEQTGRGVTNWDGEGAYTKETASVLMVMISKYEVHQLKQVVHSIDPDAFMIFTEGCYVDGNFEKRL